MSSRHAGEIESIAKQFHTLKNAQNEAWKFSCAEPSRNWLELVQNFAPKKIGVRGAS